MRSLSIGVLGLMCSAVALLLYFALIIEVGPGRATVIGYTTPIVAVVLGVALLDERLTVSAIAGVVLILAGSYLATRDPESRALVPAPREALIEPRNAECPSSFRQ